MTKETEFKKWAFNIFDKVNKTDVRSLTDFITKCHQKADDLGFDMNTFEVDEQFFDEDGKMLGSGEEKIIDIYYSEDELLTIIWK